MRIVFIGQAPSAETQQLQTGPFTGKCGKFLAQLMGLTQEEMLQRHDFYNVLDEYPGKGINGDKFPLPEAKKGAVRLRPKLIGRTTVLLGNGVARAFGMTKFEYLRQYELRDEVDRMKVLVPRIFVVPHPSGVNRMYNVPQMREDVSVFLRQLASL